MGQRPRDYLINRGHPLATGLVFGHFGRLPLSTYYHDDSLYYNHGLLTGMDPSTDWVLNPVHGWVLDFDGSDDFVDLSQSIALQPTAALSVSAWVRRDGNQANLCGVVSSPKDATIGGYILVFRNTNVASFYIREGGAWPAVDTDAAIEDGVDTHIIGTWDGVTMRIYVNGVQQINTQACASINYGTVDTNAFIGKYATIEFKGRIWDVAVYDRALSAAEITTLADPADPFLGGLIMAPQRRSFATAAAAVGGFFRPMGSMTGLGVGGPFFKDPLAA